MKKSLLLIFILTLFVSLCSSNNYKRMSDEMDPVILNHIKEIKYTDSGNGKRYSSSGKEETNAFVDILKHIKVQKAINPEDEMGGRIHINYR